MGKLNRCDHDDADDHLLQIGSHEILGVGELGGQFQLSLPLPPEVRQKLFSMKQMLSQLIVM